MPNNKYNDIINKKFNKLTVIEYVGTDNHGAKLWKCRCECGNTTVKNTSEIVSGRIKSCGCLSGYNFKTHGYSNERLYSIWKGMRKRCNNKNEHSYKDYGGRGIKVCNEWNDYPTFRSWALNNGYTDSLTIERIDVNKGYFPKNCKWITQKEQANNKRNTVKMTYKGKTKRMTEWAKIYHINYFTLHHRFCDYGWSAEKSIETPVRGLGI